MTDHTPIVNSQDEPPAVRRSDEIELEPWYKDGNDEIVQPEFVTQQSQYLWKNWLRILGTGPYCLLIRLRMYCYYNRETTERRDWCYPSQRTLANELGVERKAIIRYLQRLQVFDFIRRKHRNRWSEAHGRPVHTTNAYRIKMWDPVVPEDQGQALVREAQGIVRKVAQQGESSVNLPEYQNGTHRRPVENQPPGSQKGTQVAVPKRDNRKKYLEGVLKTVNVATHTKERLLRTADLAQQMLDELGDRHSMGFYRKVAQTIPEPLIYRALSETKEARHTGQLENPGAYFTARIKHLAHEQGLFLVPDGQPPAERRIEALKSPQEAPAAPLPATTGAQVQAEVLTPEHRARIYADKLFPWKYAQENGGREPTEAEKQAAYEQRLEELRGARPTA